MGDIRNDKEKITAALVWGKDIRELCQLHVTGKAAR